MRFLSPLPMGCRITERNNGQDFQFIWDAQERFHLLQSPEAHSVRAYPFRPGRQDHRLDRAARIRDRKHRPFNRYDNRQRCLRDIGSSFRQCAQLPQRIAVLDDNENAKVDDSCYSPSIAPPQLSAGRPLAARVYPGNCAPPTACVPRRRLPSLSPFRTTAKVGAIQCSLYHHDERFKVGAIPTSRQSDKHYIFTFRSVRIYL